MNIDELKLSRADLLRQYMELNEQGKEIEKKLLEVRGSIRFLNQAVKGLESPSKGG